MVVTEAWASICSPFVLSGGRMQRHPGLFAPARALSIGGEVAKRQSGESGFGYEGPAAFSDARFSGPFSGTKMAACAYQTSTSSSCFSLSKEKQLVPTTRAISILTMPLCTYESSFSGRTCHSKHRANPYPTANRPAACLLNCVGVIPFTSRNRRLKLATLLKPQS